MGTLIATVAHTYQIEGDDEIIRIISARFANRREKELYADTL